MTYYIYFNIYDNMNNLIWFNKEGDSLNFTYDATNDKYTSALNFDENSSDTFKTIGLYLFEKVDSFEFDSMDNDTNLQKFQLFNENRFTITGNSYYTQSITDIQTVNNNGLFYSKWIYGSQFEKMFPIGCGIKFNNPVFEFSTSIPYIVVGSKKNAIMVLSSSDNVTYNNTYYGLTFSGSISGLNSIGIYDYRRDTTDQLSQWNQTDFYSKLYNNKKLTYLSGKTQSILTVQDCNLQDRDYYNYYINSLVYTQSSDLSVLLTLKTDLPTIYSGGLNLVATSSRMYFYNTAPTALKPNTDFVINDSVLNYNILEVGNISSFVGTVTLTYYPTDSQVLWNNLVYQCVQGYTQTATSSISPDDSNYWTSSISYLPISGGVVDETILNTYIHLTTNTFLYTQSYTNSNNVTMALFAQKYAAEFNKFNINLFYDESTLNASLIYGSNYANIDYYIGTQSITQIDEIVEKVIETKEELKTYVDTNVSSNFIYSTVISKIDDYGISFLINGQTYQEPTEYIYTGLVVDQVKTIDKTLRNFLLKNYLYLASIGITTLLQSTNYIAEFDYFKDTVTFQTVYPNVPLQLSIQMGSLAVYYIKHSRINFNDIGSYLNININGIDYGQKVISTTSSTFMPDIDTTINNWVTTYSSILYGYGILVSNVRNNLYLNVSEPTTRIRYTISTNKLPTPGIDQYTIQGYLIGNFGTLIAGNQIVLTATSSQNFEAVNFSTGMITAVNNTLFPYDNQEYNILYVDNSNLGLSYQGPFWDTNGRECTVSSFTTLAFSSLAYATSPCPPSGASGGGEYDNQEFSSGFTIRYVISNDYTSGTVSTNNTNLVDMLYIDEYNKIYVLGNDLSVMYADTFELSSVISLVGNTSSIKLVYNNYNKFVYTLTSNKVYIIDPITDSIYQTISVTANDILINQGNGDVYLSVGGTSVYIYKYNSFNTQDFIISIPSAGKMEYNIIDNRIYIVGDQLYSINTTLRVIHESVSIPSLDNNYIYTEPIYGSIYVWGTTLYKITNGVVDSIPLTNSGFNKILFDNFTGDLFLSQVYLTNFIRFTSDDNIVFTQNFGYGDFVVNQFDGDIYMITPSGRINVIHSSDGSVVYTLNLSTPATKIIYDPMRGSVIVMCTSGFLFELGVIINSVIEQSPTASSPSSIYDGLFGTLAEDYLPNPNIWLKTRDYLRGPRMNYSDDVAVQFVWKFEDDQVPDIFMYDISGSQLTTGTSYSYLGEKPLSNPMLNDMPNRDLTRLYDSSAQQTIFPEISTTLEYLDDSNDLSIMPTPMELFLGYNSLIEGYESTVLKMYVRENVSFDITYDPTRNNLINLVDYGTYGIINMNQMSLDSFVYDSNDKKRGLKAGQLLQLNIVDITNSNNKYISYNNGNIFMVTQVYNTQIVVNYISDSTGMTASFVTESNFITNYPNDGNNTVLKMSFIVVDREMASIQIQGQTEIEDIRYKIELNNTGNNINPTDVYIFKTYDIDEQGVDWTFLNKKRKEMLMVRSDIFPYVGSYKAIINAINYFGYNDLQLYEYYRNINVNSPDFFKLFKVEIPDIFDTSVVGWTVNDFLKHTMPNPNFEETNLFNLTYLITDKQGNNVLLYSLQEVIIKLQGLKNWLESKVIPITHRILDITGRADFVGGMFVTHKSYAVSGTKIQETMTPIDFNVNEAYLMPVNSGSTVYNVVVDFVASKEGQLPTNFTLNIRTYKTYQEWNPFTTYNIGDQVIYYDIIYESVINSNKILDPRKYDDSPIWDPNTEYFDGAIVNYNSYAYEYLGTESSFIEFGTVSVPTPAQNPVWLNISQWVQQDLVPVQTIMEYRFIDSVTYSTTTNNLLFYTSSVSPDYMTPSPSFNFTVDSNIDPFIVIEVNSENGYGLSYTSRKNYEIRGLNDLFAGVQNIESIGPFVPIVPITISI